MELRQYIAVVRRWLWLIGLAVAVAAVSSYLASKRVTPLYRTTTTLMIGRVIESADVTNMDLWTGEQLANTYAEMARRERVLQGVVESLGLDVEWRALAGQVSAEALPNSLFLEVSVVDSNPARAKVLADAVAQQLVLMSPTNASGIDPDEQAFAQQEVDDLKAKIAASREEIEELEEARDVEVSARRIQELEGQIAVLSGKISDWQSTYAQLLFSLQGGEVNVLTVVEEAGIPSTPISPNTMRTVLLASVIALALAVGGALLVEYLDDTIKSADDAASSTGLAALGAIPRIEGEEYPAKLVVALQPLSPIAEAYRAVRTNIQFSSVDAPVRTILVTSSAPTEGKSVTLANLAAVMAQSGRRVVAVDSDLRRPVLHKIFGLPNSRGLSDAILEPNPGVAEHLQATQINNLWVLTSGATPPNPADLLGSQRMGALLEELQGIVDVAIFDSPPSLVVADAAILGSRVDGVLLVVDAGRTRRGEAERSAGELRRVGANLLGVVVNRMSGRAGGYDYYYHYYRDGGQSGRRTSRRRHRIWRTLVGKAFGATRAASARGPVVSEAAPPARGEATDVQGRRASASAREDVTAEVVPEPLVSAQREDRLAQAAEPLAAEPEEKVLQGGAVKLLSAVAVAQPAPSGRPGGETAPGAEAVPVGYDEAPARVGGPRRRMPAWGWALIGAAGLIVALVGGGYLAHVYGLLPEVLAPARMLRPWYYAPLAAVVVGLLVASVIGYVTSARRDLGDREAEPQDSAGLTSSGAGLGEKAVAEPVASEHPEAESGRVAEAAAAEREEGVAQAAESLTVVHAARMAEPVVEPVTPAPLGGEAGPPPEAAPGDALRADVRHGERLRRTRTRWCASLAVAGAILSVGAVGYAELVDDSPPALLGAMPVPYVARYLPVVGLVLGSSMLLSSLIGSAALARGGRRRVVDRAGPSAHVAAAGNVFEAGQGPGTELT